MSVLTILSSCCNTLVKNGTVNKNIKIIVTEKCVNNTHFHSLHYNLVEDKQLTDHKDYTLDTVILCSYSFIKT